MPPHELNLLDYWRIIKKRKYTIAGTAALVVLIATGVSAYFAPPPQFEAMTRVKFDRNKTFEGLFAQGVSFSYSDEMGSQVEVVRSFPVLEAVAKWLHVLPAEEALGESHSQSYLSRVYALRESIRPEQEGDTNIIKITATAADGELAVQMANAVAQAYRDYNIKTRNRLVTDSRRFIETQLSLVETKLSEAEEALREFKVRVGQVLLTDEARNDLSTLNTLEAETAQVRRSRQEAIDQLTTLEHNQGLFSTDSESERIFTDEQAQILYRLNLRLADRLQERGALLLDYTPQHPQVKVLDWKIKNIKAEMVQELTTKIQTLENRELDFQAEIQRYRDRYSRYPEKAITLTRLEREVEVNSNLYTELRAKHQEMLIKGSQQIEEVTILEPALVPWEPANAPDRGMGIMASAVMGIFLGIVAAFMQESVDASIGSPQEVEKLLDAPILGMVPQLDDQHLKEVAQAKLGPEWNGEKVPELSKLFCLLDPQSPLSENLRAIRSNIQFACVDREVKTLLVTNVGLVKGRIRTTAGSAALVSLAMLLAENGKRVLLVDANLRRPVIHKRLGLQQVPGLTDALVQGANWREQVRTWTDLMMGPLVIELVMSIPGLDLFDVLPAGTVCPNPSKLLHSVKLGELINEMREHYDYVLLDAPPMLPVADSTVLSSKVDGVILLCQEGKTTRGALHRTKMLLDRARAKLLGIILTNARPKVVAQYTRGQSVGQFSHQV